MSAGTGGRRRVVSLVPSATETLLALGADVIACTRFCEQPHLTHVGGTKDPDVAAIVALAPDLVVLDEEENRREDADALAAAGLDLCVTAVRSVAGATEVVAELARRAGVAASVAPPASAPSGSNGPPARAFVPIWRRPWMALGDDTYGASLLALAGVDVVTGGVTGRYPMVDLAAVVADAPDLVLVPSEPYRFRDRHVAELADALPAAAVVRVDGQDLFWWGTRTPGAVDRLRSVIHNQPRVVDRGGQNGVVMPARRSRRT